MTKSTHTAIPSGPSNLTSLTRLPEAARFNLRIDLKSVAKASEAIGFKLPRKIGERTTSGEIEATQLGPDEWVITAPETKRDIILSAFAQLYETCTNSLTDISDREITLVIEGELAADLISIASPLNLKKFAIGCSARTVFDSAQIVLHRDTENRFRIDVWRSFFPHVWQLLNVGNKELNAGF